MAAEARLKIRPGCKKKAQLYSKKGVNLQGDDDIVVEVGIQLFRILGNA